MSVMASPETSWTARCGFHHRPQRNAAPRRVRATILRRADPPRLWSCLLSLLVPLGWAGCSTQRHGLAPAEGQVLFNAEGGTTWRNHVTVVRDPAGAERSVMQAERIGDDHCKMTFVNKRGFFPVPRRYSGEVALRVFVRGRGRLRATLASENVHKSYRRGVPVEGQWFEVTLPLNDLRGKMPPGTRIQDITLWLLPAESDALLPADAGLYLDSAVWRHP